MNLMEPKTFRILSLDGGGIMGAFSAAVPAEFENVTGRRIVEHFDLITGTSKGGIIAIGLAMGATAEDISRFYETEGPRIFPKRSGVRAWLGLVRDVFKPRYPNAALRGDQDGRRRATAEGGEDEAGHPDLRREHRQGLPVQDAAPPLEPEPRGPAGLRHRAGDLGGTDRHHTIPGRGTFIDGGLWANCPAMVGVVEALDFLGQAPEQVRMLSLSTTSYPFRLADPAQLRGLVGQAPKLIDTFMFGQAQAAVNMARCLLPAAG